MLKLYCQTLNNFFFFFEKTLFINYFFKNNNFLMTLIFLDSKKVLRILSKLLFLSKSQLLELSATNFLPKLNKIAGNIIYFVLYNIFLKKYFFLLFLKRQINSIAFIWKGAVWLEREVKEFYSIQVAGSTDTRNLFLDYNITYNPLLKSFPVEGIEEVYFNLSQNNLIFLKTNHIEL